MRLTLILATCIVAIAPAAFAEPLDLEKDCQAQWNALILAFNDQYKVRRRTDRAFNAQAGLNRDDQDPTTVLLRRTQALLADLKGKAPAEKLKPLQAQLQALAEQVAKAPQAQWGSGKILTPVNKDVVEKNGRVVTNKADRYPLFKKIYLLQRKIAFTNPLLDFDKILFLKRNPAAYSHMVDQYFGITQHPGGGVFVLEDAFTDAPQAKDLLADSTVQNGRLKGQKLVPGSFLSPDLSFDGEEVVFSFVELKEIWLEMRDDGRPNWKYQDTDWSNQTCFHVFKVNADGSNLRQLTDGPFNDTDPCFLPNGRIAFISERRLGQGRCHPGRNCTSYVLHSMLPDGKDIVPLSWHETNEWSPAVNNHGEIVYSRWDYVDRPPADGQYPWVTKPDGRDAKALVGNWDQGRLSQTEFDAMPIPDNDSLYIGTLSAHHNQSYGSFSIFDASVWDYKNPEEANKYYTPEISGGHSDGAYATAWPLATNYLLCVYSPLAPGYWNGPAKPKPPYETPIKHGIYLLDAFGNRILLYRDEKISCISPIPFKPRKAPPRIPHMTENAYPPDMQGREEGEPVSTLAVMDVYKSLFPWPEDRKISRLRVIQVFIKPTIGQNNPRVGYATMMSPRRSLGTVPIESDGSVHFKMPAKVPVYFQVLDEKGLAIQSMKSVVYTQHGETLTCVGCHEPKDKAKPLTQGNQMPLALKRKASLLVPEVNRNEPVSFARLVQPVLDAKCVKCHEKNEKAIGLSSKTRRGFSEAYKNLEPYAWYISGRPDKYRMKEEQVRTVPGTVGACNSKLYKLLTTGSHKDKVELTDQELQRITLWMDLNSPYLGVFDDPRTQSEGELVDPIINDLADPNFLLPQASK